MDCCTHESIFAFPTCRPKIHLVSHSGMSRSQVGGLMCRMAHSLLFLLLYFDMASQEYPKSSGPLRHNKSREGLVFPDLLFLSSISVPASPVEGNGLGLTQHVQHIHFRCIAESLFPYKTPPSVTPLLTTIFQTPGGGSRGLAKDPHPVPLSTLGRKYSTAPGTAGAISSYH